MVTFPLPLNVEVSKNGRTMHLLDPVYYVEEEDGTYLVIKVPAGFETDFNSVPRFFWRFLGPWEFPQAAVVHDYLYREKIGCRSEADEIHYKALVSLGCPQWKALGAWVALRLFGGIAGNWEGSC